MKKFSRIVPMLLAASALVLILAACGGSPSTPDAAATTAPQSTQDTASATTAPAASDAVPQIESYKLLQDNGSGAAGDEVKGFKITDHVQYFDVQLTGFLKTGSVVKWVFTAVDTSAGKDVKITEADVNVLVGNKLTSNLKLDKDFPAGSYKADITADGQPVGTINYTVGS